MSVYVYILASRLVETILCIHSFCNVIALVVVVVVIIIIYYYLDQTEVNGWEYIALNSAFIVHQLLVLLLNEFTDISDYFIVEWRQHCLQLKLISHGLFYYFQSHSYISSIPLPKKWFQYVDLLIMHE